MNIRMENKMDGIVLVDKKIDWTSRDVVNKLTRRLGTKKIGHTGTLDPFATGLLVITIGKGTKAGQFLEAMDKTYIATLKLGKSTDTLDFTGNVTSEKEVKLPLDKVEVKNVLKSFLGEIEQIPPKYSAIKINGVRAYELARNGEEVTIPSRKVTIHELELIDIKDDEISFKVHCSKGTYVRTLGEDIASKLGYPGHLTSLRRIQVGDFKIEDALDVNEIEEKDIVPITSALTNYKKYICSPKETEMVKNGVKLKINDTVDLFMVSQEGEALAIYSLNKDGYYHTVRGLF
jgi:tRNA pseudouridine55 synthase